MGFFRRGKHANYSLLQTYNWYIPGIGGTFAMLGFLLAGVVLSSIVALGITRVDIHIPIIYIQLVTYPIMFIPAMFFARMASNRKMYFNDGYALDSKNFGQLKSYQVYLLAMLATLALSFVMDWISTLLPAMPEKWKNAMEGLTSGNFALCFICTCIFAPFFEEWLVRGIILRGLLNCNRSNGRRGYSPVLSIIASSVIFAVIHFNIWQGLPAFALGCLFGYVYYKTGSLKTTMLMHFANNFTALLAGELTNSSMENWRDVIPSASNYYAILAAGVAIIVLCIYRIRKIDTSPQGGCSLISAA